MSGDRDFLDEFTEQEADVVVEQPKESVESTGRQRGPDGKFIKAEAEARAQQVETGAKQAADEAAGTVPPTDDEEYPDTPEGFVPMAAFLKLRKAMQELKSKAQPQTQQPQAPQFQGPSVDFDEDPKAHMMSLKMEMSKFMASQQNDEQTVNAAWAAFDQACLDNPDVSAMSYRLVNHPHPMAEIVKWYKRERELAAIQEAGGLEALKQRWLQEQGIAPQAAPVQQAPNVPPSLAGTGKPRSSQSVNDVDDGFDALFKR